MDTSPNRREAARREQAQRDDLPLVSFDNGKGPVCLFHRQLRSGTAVAFRRMFPPNTSLSGRGLYGFFSLNADFTGTIYHSEPKMSSLREFPLSGANRKFRQLAALDKENTGAIYYLQH